MDIKKFCLMVFCLISLAACGGGGGGGGDSTDYNSSAEVDVQVTPNEIDTGDRMYVSVKIANTHVDGVVIKVRFPIELGYVYASSYLHLDNNVSLSVKATNYESAGKYSYLVYYFKHVTFGNNDRGELTFELIGNGATKGKVEVDADVNNLSIDDSREFDVRNPEFTEESDADIKVRG